MYNQYVVYIYRTDSYLDDTYRFYDSFNIAFRSMREMLNYCSKLERMLNQTIQYRFHCHAMFQGERYKTTPVNVPEIPF